MRDEDRGEPYGFARRLAEEIARCCSGALRGAYLHGSAALGGWVAERSDVDVLLVADDEIGEASVRAVGELLAAADADCPGAGLEVSLVTVDQAATPRAPYMFLLHVAREAADGMRVVYGTEVSGDPDLIMGYVVCREAGITLYGAPARELVGPVARGVVLRYLASELEWGVEHGTESYAVLNACRALEYLDGGRVVSKVAGGEAALARGSGPAGLIGRALEQQRALAQAQRPEPAAIEFAREVGARLAGAALASEAELPPGDRS
ncbi:MAG TPA: aminoglycoside adenylyltransferase domain-containing protein [Streptosporangiaceae bacterium]|nr:aminoglycoside adenylyltransferase domain-containing protein [Streptosporangiaceae bacterium]